MKITNEAKQKVQEAAAKAGGYLTAELYNKYRGSLPSWEKMKKDYNISFDQFLNSCEVMSKNQHLKVVNRAKAISNLKILFLEHGSVSKTLYDREKLSPTSEYLSRHYGWDTLIKEAGVKVAGSQYQTTEQLIQELKLTIKQLGYIPTSGEYKALCLRPTQEALSNKGVEWTAAMKKVGYKTYGKSVKVKDKICGEPNCFRQFTPQSSQELFCEECFKAMRGRIIKNLEKLNSQALKSACEKLIYNGNSQAQLINIFLK